MFEPGSFQVTGSDKLLRDWFEQDKSASIILTRKNTSLKVTNNVIFYKLYIPTWTAAP